MRSEHVSSQKIFGLPFWLWAKVKFTPSMPLSYTLSMVCLKSGCLWPHNPQVYDLYELPGIYHTLYPSIQYNVTHWGPETLWSQPQLLSPGYESESRKTHHPSATMCFQRLDPSQIVSNPEGCTLPDSWLHEHKIALAYYSFILGLRMVCQLNLTSDIKWQCWPIKQYIII